MRERRNNAAIFAGEGILDLLAVLYSKLKSKQGVLVFEINHP